jgi:hypothetical protein
LAVVFLTGVVLAAGFFACANPVAGVAAVNASRLAATAQTRANFIGRIKRTNPPSRQRLAGRQPAW